jgi:hypothetical protein
MMSTFPVKSRKVYSFVYEGNDFGALHFASCESCAPTYPPQVWRRGGSAHNEGLQVTPITANANFLEAERSKVFHSSPTRWVGFRLSRSSFGTSKFFTYCITIIAIKHRRDGSIIDIIRGRTDRETDLVKDAVNIGAVETKDKILCGTVGSPLFKMNHCLSGPVEETSVTLGTKRSNTASQHTPFVETVHCSRKVTGWGS